MLADPHCRVGRVRFRRQPPPGAGRHGTATLRLVHGDEGRPVAVIDGFLRNARTIESYFAATGDAAMAGYVILAWTPDGAWSCGWRNGANSPIATTMLPVFLGEAARREVIEWSMLRQLRGQTGPDSGA